MLAGVWTAQESAVIRNVTHSACGRPGSLSTARQLSSPVSLISPSVSQEVKLSSRTPTSGISAKAAKTTSAGVASHGRTPPPRALGATADDVLLALIADMLTYR